MPPVLSKKWRKAARPQQRDDEAGKRPRAAETAAFPPAGAAASGSGEEPPLLPPVLAGWEDSFHERLEYDIAPDAAARFAQLFGIANARAEYARLGLATPGSRVIVRLDEDGDIQVNCESEHAQSEVATQCLSGRLELVLAHVTIRSDLQAQGLGTWLIAGQVRQALALGFRVILAYASRGKAELGYYSFPRMGFDGRIPDEVRRNLPARFRPVTTLLDLLASPEGRRGWVEHGLSVLVEFDLRPGSRSRIVLNEYLAQQGFRSVK